MDLTMIGIFVGFVLTGIVAGIPIGQAYQRRAERKPRRPIVLTKRDAQEILNRSKVYRGLAGLPTNGRRHR